MDQDALVPIAQANPSAWRVRPGENELVQGLVVSGFGHLPAGQALLLRQTSPGGGWLAALNRVAPVTNATTRAPLAASLAFTSTGLAMLGLDAATLSRFDIPFQQGMQTQERRRRLGDLDPRMIAAGGLRWCGATEPSETTKEVHALLLLYGSDQAGVTAWSDEVIPAIGPQIDCVSRLSLDLHRDENGLSREHFGFVDGLSQPIPTGAPFVGRDGQPMTKDPWHGIESGDVLLGYTNAYGDPAPGPYVPDDPIGRRAGLVQGTAPEGYLDLGLNGTYLVVRELQQDVPGFWSDMDRCAAVANAAGSSETNITAEWLAERVIGRDLGRGDLLSLSTETGASSTNATGFFEADRYGDGCPLGAHVRRANPRDGLAGAPEFTLPVLAGANNHRLLRRGRKFGSKIADRNQPDGEERGLFFMCLNTDIARQFEFVQQTWLLNPSFATLHDQTDPLIGPPGLFTIPQTPLRHQLHLQNHIRLAGGDYFFLPSVPALSYLRELR